MKYSLLFTVFFGLFAIIKCEPQFSAYRGGLGLKYFPAYEEWLNREIIYGLDFQASEGGTWMNIEGENWFLQPWSQWVQNKTGRVFVMTIPMLPKAVQANFTDGAAGLYDVHFANLAKNLTKYKFDRTNLVIRLGSEFNGDWTVYWSGLAPTLFVPYWKRIVTAIRSVHPFKIEWNPVAGGNATMFYPGTDYVDYIGLDLYDQSWAGTKTYTFLKERGYWHPKANYTVGNSVEYEGEIYKSLTNHTNIQPGNSATTWEKAVVASQVITDRKNIWENELLNGKFNLAFYSQFAKQCQKPFVIQEWGVTLRDHGGHDNAYFIEQMHKFIHDPANNVAWATYFDVTAPDGDHLLVPREINVLPQASAKYRELFGVTHVTSITDVTSVTDSISNASETNGTIETTDEDNTSGSASSNYFQYQVILLMCICLLSLVS